MLCNVLRLRQLAEFYLLNVLNVLYCLFERSIPSVYPRFSHVRPKGNIIEIDALKSNLSHLSYYADVKLTIRNQTSQLWWEVYDQNPKDRQNNPKDHGIPCNSYFYSLLGKCLVTHTKNKNHT